MVMVCCTVRPQLEAFDALGVAVVGVRNEAGEKYEYEKLRLAVDAGDEVRSAIGIAKDFGVLAGRETYLVDKKGVIVNVRLAARAVLHRAASPSDCRTGGHTGDACARLPCAPAVASRRPLGVSA